jgi:hypothetical protein
LNPVKTQLIASRSAVLLFCIAVAVCPATAQELDLEDLRGTLEVGTHTIAGTATLTGDLTVPVGATLNIAAGTALRADNFFHSLIVKGTLNATGTAGSPVTFTSIDANTKGAWGGVVFEPGSSGTLNNASFAYGGGETAGLIVINNAAVTITQCSIQNSSRDGIWGNNASPTITSSSFSDNESAAIWLVGVLPATGH